MTANKRDKVILSSIGEAEREVKTAMTVPAGYIEIRLSTKGKVGAPEVIHVRNFKISDVMALSMSGPSDLPARLINILNDVILEDVDVSLWHEKEIEELMVYIFLQFYSGILKDIQYPLNENDIDYIRKMEDGEKKLRDIEEGRWIPRTDIDIAGGVDTYDIPENYSSRVTVTNKKTGFKVTFDYIKYGDQLVIKNWLDSYFDSEEKRFSRIKRQLEVNNNLSSRFMDNPEMIDKYIEVDKNEEKEYRDYLIRRTQTITDIANVVSIVEIDGEDVSGLSVGEKYDKLAHDARIDYNLIAHLSKIQSKTPIGIKPEVTMRSPITDEVVKRPFSFRIPALIQAMQLSGFDDSDDCFDDEN